MSSVNPKKLKVLELKRELEQRSIPVSKSMKKAELVALLVSALESEAGQEKVFSPEVFDASPGGPEDDKQVENLDVLMKEEPNLRMDEQVGVNSQQAPHLSDSEDKCVVQMTEEEECYTKNELVEKDGSHEEHAKADRQDEAVPLTCQELQPQSSENCGEQGAVDEPSDGQSEEKAYDCSKETVGGSSQNLGHKRKLLEKSDEQIDWEDRHPQREEEDEQFDDSLVALDMYNSDLNFKISRDRISGQPLTMEGFAFLWAGVRATYGVKSGKVCFECKITEEDPVKHLPSDEPHPHVVRVGWSADYSSLQLGEDASSYGYGGTGKFSTSHSFSDYGETFCAGDVIGCYVNFCEEGQMQISFSKNGVFQGIAFSGTNPQDKALFPHVLCKNTSVELNFGQRESPFYATPVELEGHVFLSCVPPEERVRAVKGPQSKEQCEVLMMCGLPGAGKTYYCRQKMKDEPEKKYNILGTNIIMEKMRVMGVARKKNYAGRWDLLIDNATQCLNRLLQIACRRHRNYILDQVCVAAIARVLFQCEYECREE